MKLFLVRHAKAEPRKGWTGDDLLRPLIPSGHEQAKAIGEHLADEALVRVVSSPTLRCQQSLEPLTLSTGVCVEVDERLGEDESVQRALELFPGYGEGPVLLCTHPALVVDLLRVFELIEPDALPPCKRGSIWLLEGPGYTPTRATYFEPVRRPGEPGRVRLAGPATTPQESTRAAVLDLGSTSFNLLIADVTAKGSIRPLVREKFMLRLGSVIATKAVIPKSVCTRALEVARDLRDVADQEKVQRVFPVATAALRDADNGADLADRIARTVGTEVRILSGEEEARLMFRAFQHRVPLDREAIVGFDLGGGSLELALGNQVGIEREVTLPLGVARIHSEIARRDPLKKSEVRRIETATRDRLAPHREALRAAGNTRAVGTGGAVRALALLLAERRTRRGSRPAWPKSLRVDALRELRDDLVCSTHDERLAMRGIRKRRADLLPTAAVIVTTLADELGLERLIVSDWGLREGVLMDALCPPR